MTYLKYSVTVKDHNEIESYVQKIWWKINTFRDKHWQSFPAHLHHNNGIPYLNNNRLERFLFTNDPKLCVITGLCVCGRNATIF